MILDTNYSLFIFKTELRFQVNSLDILLGEENLNILIIKFIEFRFYSCGFSKDTHKNWNQCLRNLFIF